jgi:hypothetical protein
LQKLEESRKGAAFRAEAEESPLLEAVARERPVKTQQAGKDFAGAVVICKVWKSAMVL